MGLFFSRIRVGFLFSCLVYICVAFFGCEMYTDDILFSQNQNTRNQALGKIELSAESQQPNDFGFNCIPTGVISHITAYFSNLDDLESDVTIGEIGSTSDVIRISKSVLPLASVVQSDSGLFQVALAAADISMEHTDFTIVFAPVSSSGVVVQPQSMTLRYNTPPGVPLGVVPDLEGNLKLMTSEVWDVVVDTGDKSKDGYIFWAWPKGMTTLAGCDQRLPDCISTFVLNGRAYTPAECATGIVLQCDSGGEYDVYRLYVGYNSSVELYAKDVESVCSPSLISGMEFIEVSLDAAGAFFEGTFDSSMTFYNKQAVEYNLEDFPVPVKDGYAFSGWSIGDTDIPVSFPFHVKEDVTLTALWQNPATVGEVRNLQGLFNFETGSISVTWSHPYVADTVGLKMTLQGNGLEREELVYGHIEEVLFDGIEKDTGEYLITVKVIGADGNESAGLSTNVSSNTEFYDEVGNLQAIVLSDMVDFYWTSPPKDDISHILIACHDSEGEIVADPHIVDKHERSTTILIEDNWPRIFHFYTVDLEGMVSEGMDMYTIDLEIDGNPDSIDERLIVPADIPLEASPSYYLLNAPVKEGFIFDGWYADNAFESPYDVSVPVSVPSQIFAKWKEVDNSQGSFFMEQKESAYDLGIEKINPDEEVLSLAAESE